MRLADYRPKSACFGKPGLRELPVPCRPLPDLSYPPSACLVYRPAGRSPRRYAGLCSDRLAALVTAPTHRPANRRAKCIPIALAIASAIAWRPAREVMKARSVSLVM